MRFSAKKLIFFLVIVLSTSISRETRQRIAVIDTGMPKDTSYMCQNGHRDLTGKGIEDHFGHGSNVAGIIQSFLDKKKQCIVVIKWWAGSASMDIAVKAIEIAIEQKAVIINLSYSGEGYNVGEYQAISKALERGIIVVVSAGNDGKDLDKECNYYPGCYGFKNKNFHVVANYTGIDRTTSTNYNGPVTDKENGNNITANGFTDSGTSQAAAVVSGKLAYGLQ